MAYFAWTFWLLVIVLTAWGVRALLTGIIAPKVLNAVLLPGTLVGLAGHVLGLLVSGATIRDTTLIKDDDSGEPGTTADPQPKIPILGPILIAMLPLLACAAAIHFSASYFGNPVLRNMRTDVLGPTLPTTWSAFWQMLRDQVTLVESFAGAVMRANLANWKTLLFLYLTICLSVRMAPFPGTARGTLGAIVLLGGLAAFATWALALSQKAASTAWPTINLIAAALLALLLISLVVRGGLVLVQVLRNKD